MHHPQARCNADPDCFGFSYPQYQKSAGCRVAKKAGDLRWATCGYEYGDSRNNAHTLYEKAYGAAVDGQGSFSKCVLPPTLSHAA